MNKEMPKQSEKKEENSDEMLLNWISEERLFLHEISTPMTVALGMTESALLKIKNGESDITVSKLEKTMEALTQLTETLVERRRVLVSRKELLSP